MSPLISLSFSPSLSLCFLLCCLWLTVCTVEVRWRAFRPIQLSQAWGLNNTQSPVTLHRLQLSCRWLVQLSVILQYKYKTHLFSPLSLPLFTSIVGSRLCLFFFFHLYTHARIQCFFHLIPCLEVKCAIFPPTQSNSLFSLVAIKLW